MVLVRARLVFELNPAAEGPDRRQAPGLLAFAGVDLELLQLAICQLSEVPQSSSVLCKGASPASAG